MGLKELINKYSTSGPRYTSYPTAPQWVDSLTVEAYREQLKKSFSKKTDPIALYVHIPFCEALCYYCGCNIQITKDHTRSQTYLNSLIKEMKTVTEVIGSRQSLSQISWGGGTPTFMTVDEITKLHEATLQFFDLVPNAEVSIEIDPRVTSREQLKVLRELGFNRVSLGVQDFNEDVQKAINRVQSVKMTGDMLKFCRELGFEGINFDLIYGLPLQTRDSFKKTVEQVVQLKPDRIALYNYAHLPSLRPHQKIMDKFARPDTEERLAIFLDGYQEFTDHGYQSIGLDHFALDTDELFRAIEKETLYRNFMGYTVKRGAGMIGIGASAIGEIGNSYFQNIREAKNYEESVAQTGMAAFRGLLLSPEDEKRKWIIQQLMCKFILRFSDFQSRFGSDFKVEFESELRKLEDFSKEGILNLTSEGIAISELGRLVIRNVAMVFDAYLNLPGKATYSKTL
ncbi:MAG: oxygen-independent coproporphyrinogen III oxidase [Proteobacteria bacterium]|nr:oxygen-independent coproporphyrinogen III oxidase [Pseudomonadota bacterium]